MKLQTSFKWMALSAAITTVALAPAFADDTDLLLINPNVVEPPKPNILFILDSSGSMKDPVNSSLPYNKDTDYTVTDGCDKDYLYWTDVDVVPSCDSSNTRRIKKSAFVCEAANRQLDGLGLFTDNMIQFRDGSSGFFSFLFGLETTRWQQLEPGNDDDIVECNDDREEHGPNDTSTDVFASRFGSADGDLADAYTADEGDEVSWGSWPTSQTITVYDGNYLNYRANPVVESQKKVDIMKAVTKIVLDSVDNVNVGIMRFNDEEGGVVIGGMSDLDTNREAIKTTIDSITADGYTPLAESLYEAARYWRGLSADYGALDDWATATNALSSAAGETEVYQAPTNNVCTSNFNVMLSDGTPVRDQGGPSKVLNLPEWADVMGKTTCDETGDSDGDGACLPDIGEYLYTGDIAPTVRNQQNVITHTIGFAIDLPILKSTAESSGGEYFKADDIEGLALALLTIVNTITERSLSFSAPAVAVNTFNRTRNLNDLYLTTFAAKENLQWPGNLKKFQIKDGQIVDANLDPAVNELTGFFKNNATSFWDTVEDGNDVTKGGAANQLPAPASRNLFTNISTDPSLWSNANALSNGNIDSFTLADFGLTGSTDEPSMEDLIDWARGVDVNDVVPDSDVRNAMGDPLHSQPAAVVYGGTEASPEAVVFTATNDGYVHAIDAATGVELWSFIPAELLPNLVKLFFNPAAQYKNYGVDGDIIPVVKDNDGDGIIEADDDDFVYIVFGMRRGGSAYYALDVTDKNKPELLWRVSASLFGQSWSAPSIARIDIADKTQNADNAVVIIGGGYDTVHDSLSPPDNDTDDTNGAGIFFLDLVSGDILWRAGPDDDADLTIPEMNRSIPTQVRVIDISGDGIADRMYAADMGGQILRFDIFDGEEVADLVTGGVIAQLGAKGMDTPTNAENRRFYTAPDISVFNDNAQNRRFIAISIGSGWRAGPLDNTPNDRFYSLRDPDIFNSLTQDDYDGYDIIKEGDLVETRNGVAASITSDKDGWKYTLPANQKVLSNSVTFNNEIFFVAFDPNTAEAEACAAGLGRNFLYQVSVTNADPLVQNASTFTGAEADAARVSDLAQGGIAPSPQFLFPTPDADCEGPACNPPPLGCIGVECFDPGFANNPVRTLWSQDGIE